jgi:hypothetical protein
LKGVQAMAPTSDSDRRHELDRLRREMAELMLRIQAITQQQIDVMDRCSSEEELEADATYQALTRQKESLGAQYRTLARRADQLVDQLDD